MESPARGNRLIHFFSFAMWMAIVLSSANAQLANAALTLGTTFSDNMVVQRDQPVIVWGESAPGAVVNVKLGDESSSATADASGHWKVALKPLAAGGPYAATITSGSESIGLQNILSGDVWLCSGQSNMQLSVGEDVEARQMEAEAGALPTLRLLSIPKFGADQPRYRIDAHWTGADVQSLDHFSAVAVHFALALSKDPKLAGIPIGIIDSSFGGTSAEGWTPTSALGHFSKEQFSISMFNLQPGSLYNGMIAPLGPLALTGTVWYQGENNSGKSQFYPAIMHQLILQWRKQFHNPHLPFIVVQLPPFTDLYAGFPFTWVREAQSRVAQENPFTGLVVSIDTTNGFNLHPRQKGEIGRRAALQARRIAYHEDVVADGPTFKSIARQADALRITFDTHDGPLVMHGDIRRVLGFSVAGDDHVFHFADASLDGGDAVVVRCADVPDPRFVRYAWAAVPACNLYNAAGLPAGPFRTDDLPPTVPIEIKPMMPSRRITTDLYDVVITGGGDLASLGVDKQQFISGDLDGFGICNFPTFFGPRQLQNATELTSDSISFSDAGLRETYSFSKTSMTLRIENLGKDASSKALFHLRLASGVRISGQPDGFDFVRGHSHVRLTGADTAKDNPAGGGDVEMNLDGNATRTLVFDFSKSN
jgi:sialate O-acetylesterase